MKKKKAFITCLLVLVLSALIINKYKGDTYLISSDNISFYNGFENSGSPGSFEDVVKP